MAIFNCHINKIDKLTTSIQEIQQNSWDPAPDTGKKKKKPKGKKKPRKNKKREEQKMVMTLEEERRQLLRENGYLSAANEFMRDIIRFGTVMAKGQPGVDAMTIADEVVEHKQLPKGR